jgi:ribosomal protein S18 acetylase RimI-like enzyme
MIRRMAPEDADQVAAVYTASFETLQTFLPDLHTTEERRAFITEVVPRDHELWVAEEDGRVVGLAAVGADTLGHLYVHPDHQGRGIGTALLEKTKELRPDGFTLWTFPANVAACRFYERHGLRAIEHGDGSGNEEGVPDVRYAWRTAR